MRVDGPLDPDEVSTSLQTQVDLDELAFSRAAAIGYPVIVASFASSGRATVFDCHGLAGGELRPVRVAAGVRVTPSPPERPGD